MSEGTTEGQVVDKSTQSLISILFKGGTCSEMWYAEFQTDVREGQVAVLTYRLADPEQKIHHIALDQIVMITVKQTKSL